MSEFSKAYSNIESSIKSDKQLLPNVKIIALLGSAAVEEQSGSWSDLDVLVIMKSDRAGNIPIPFLDRLKQISCKVSEKHDFPISLLTHTEDDFSKYVCFEYLIHYSFGHCTYPDTNALKELIKRVLRQRKNSEEIRKNYFLYHLRHTRFNLIRKYVSLNGANLDQSEKDFLKLLIDKMIKVTDLSLNLQNIWPKTKKEILETAKNRLPFDTKILEEALRIRNDWSTISGNQIKSFIPMGMGYAFSVFNTLLENNQRPTPEENMSLF